MKSACIVLILLLIALNQNVVSYNIRTSTYEIIESPALNGSYFGYSLTTRGNGFSTSLLVGAPRDHLPNETVYESPGAVYNCTPSAEAQPICTRVALGDPDIDIHHGDDKQHPFKDKKDNQWLGVSSTTLHKDNIDYTMICGHRWGNSYHLDVTKEYGMFFLNGLCHLIGNSTNTTFRFVHSLNEGVHTGHKVWFHALTQSGMSVHGAKDGNFYIGAPGYFNWRGGIRKLNPSDGEHCQIAGMVLGLRDYSYTGYSLSSGNYFGGNDVLIAAGGPSGSFGDVIIASINGCKGTIHHILSGTQFGSCFGTSLLTIDENHDGIDDLLVGAPLHKVDTGDDGLVFMYHGKRGGLAFNRTIHGAGAGGARFGSTLVSPGDLDGDGYSDLIISAPFEDGGQGAVYIYSGGLEGISHMYTQRIAARHLSYGLRGFGQSVVGWIDAGSTMTEVAVGAYESETLVLFKTRPVINIQLQSYFRNNCIDLIDMACASIHGEPLPCASLSIDFRWSTKAKQAIGGFLKFQINVTLNDAEKRNRRAYLTRNEKRVFTVTDTFYCRQDSRISYAIKVYFPRRHKDKLNPVNATISYKMDSTYMDENMSETHSPVLNSTETEDQSAQHKMVHICKDCREINRCETDISLNSSSSVRTVAVGDTRPLTITFYVSNDKEPSFQTELLVTFPVPLQVKNIRQDDKSRACNQLESPSVALKKTSTIFLCEMGNPLNSKCTASVAFEVDVKGVSTEDTLRISSSVSTWSFENDVNKLNNQDVLEIPVKYNASLAISSFSAPPDIILNKEIDSTRGHIIRHGIDIMNSGFGITPVTPVVLSFSSLRELNIVTIIEGIMVSYEERFQPDQSVPTECSYISSQDETITERVRVFGTAESSVKVEDKSVTSFFFKALVYSNFESKEKERFTPESHPSMVILCNLNPILPGTRVTITYNLLMNVKDISKFKKLEFAEFVTTIKLPVTFNESASIEERGKIVNKIYPPIDLVEKSVPWYISVASAIAGLILLIILIVIFSKCGFFKRSRLKDMGTLSNAGQNGVTCIENKYQGLEGAVGYDLPTCSDKNLYEELPECEQEADPYLNPVGPNEDYMDMGQSSPDPSSPTCLLDAEHPMSRT